MAWVVDTCIVIDVLEHDPRHGLRSARLLETLRGHGLVVSPVTMVELAPAFAGDLVEQKRFLTLAGIGHGIDWTAADTEAAHLAWNAYIGARRRRGGIRRPVADILIGAFATRFQGLVTRNARDFRPCFPTLDIKTS